MARDGAAERSVAKPRPPARARPVVAAVTLACLLAAVAPNCAGGALVPVDVLPLRTFGRDVVDRNGRRVRLFCVNWYGSHMGMLASNGLNRQPLDVLAARIAEMGFNCVRLPFALTMLVGNATHAWQDVMPRNPKFDMKANPALHGMNALEVFDETVAALARHGLMVILNNHVSSPMWCCHGDDGEGLWHTREYPESAFLEGWSLIAERYSHEPLVVGADLRNELRQSGKLVPSWGDGNPDTDWADAAVRAARVVLEKAPDMLIIVAGLNYCMFLCEVPLRPIHESVPELRGRVVYTSHEYAWLHIRLTARMIMETMLIYLGVAFLVVFLFLLGLCPARAAWRRHRASGGRRLPLPEAVHVALAAGGAAAARVGSVLGKCCRIGRGDEVRRKVMGSVCWGSALILVAVVFLVLGLHNQPRCEIQASVTFVGALLIAGVLGCLGLVLWLRAAALAAAASSLRQEAAAAVAIADAATSAPSSGATASDTASPTNIEADASPGGLSSEDLPEDVPPPPPCEFGEVPPVAWPEGTADLPVKAKSDAARDRARRLRRRLHRASLTREALALALAVVCLVALASARHHLGSYEVFKEELDSRWGFLLHGGKPTASAAAVSPAPVWLGEFGTDHHNFWWTSLMRYMEENSVDFAYWSWNGEKWPGKAEAFGLVQGHDSLTVRHSWKLRDLHRLMGIAET